MERHNPALWQINILHDKQVLGRDTRGAGARDRMRWRELAVISVLKPEEMIQEMGAPDMMVSYRTQAPIIMGAQCTHHKLMHCGKKRTPTIS
jgi:hypothetical protein